MPRYVAFLRGVSPMNAKMPELRRAFEQAGFTDVKTILSSGNVAFTARSGSPEKLARQAEAAMTQLLGRPFATIVRASSALQQLLDADPFAAFKVPSNAKRIVTFLGQPHPTKLKLPVHTDGVHVYAVTLSEALIAYEPDPRGPVFMTLIGKTFGESVTTRTWDTVKKCATA